MNIFDGQSEKLLTGYDVLVVENKIKKIGKGLEISSTYEIDVKTGGLKEVGGGSAQPEKKVKKEVKVNLIGKVYENSLS